MTDGYNGGLYSSNRFPLGGPAAGGSLGIKAGKFGISANSGASLYHNPSIKANVSRLTRGIDQANLTQQQDQEQETRSVYFGLELSYDHDTLNLITAQFNINGNVSDNHEVQESVMSKIGEVIQAYKLRNAGEGNGNGTDVSMNYQRQFKNDNSRLLTFSYRYYLFNDRSDKRINISDRVFYTAPSMLQTNKSRSYEQTLQADYVQRLGDINVEGGLKVISRRNTSRFGYGTVGGTETMEAHPGSLNFFNDRQEILASYGSLHYDSGKWGIKAGLRLEQTDVDVKFVSTDTDLSKSYLSMLPSASLKYKINEASSMTMGYSRRIQRPGIYQLNPFTDRSNPDFEISGNPEIKPAMYNSLELGFSRTKNLSIFLNLSYMFSNSMIFRISSYDPVSKVSRTTYRNTGQTKLPGIDYSIKYPLTGRTTITLNGKIAYGIIKRNENSQELKHEGLMYRYYASATHKIRDKWYLSADVLLNGGNLSAQGQSNAFIVTSFKADRTLIKDKLSISAMVSNPFTKFRINTVETSSPDFNQTNDSRIYFRVFNFSAHYRFGMLKDAIKKGKRGIKNDDISGNSGL
jgi:outer membrane receptor protein involved in Fe transport